MLKYLLLQLIKNQTSNKLPKNEIRSSALAVGVPPTSASYGDIPASHFITKTISI